MCPKHLYMLVIYKLRRLKLLPGGSSIMGKEKDGKGKRQIVNKK